MNLTEAKAIVEELLTYKGRPLVPLLATVKDFIIVPAGKKEFDLMFKDIIDTQRSLELALQPFEDDVTILVYFDMPIATDETRYCSYEYFLSVSNIHLQSYQPAI